MFFSSEQIWRTEIVNCVGGKEGTAAALWPIKVLDLTIFVVLPPVSATHSSSHKWNDKMKCDRFYIQDRYLYLRTK